MIFSFTFTAVMAIVDLYCDLVTWHGISFKKSIAMSAFATIAVFTPVCFAAIPAFGPNIGIQMLLEGKEDIPENEQKDYTFCQRFYYSILIFSTQLANISQALSLDENYEIRDEAKHNS